MEGSALSFQESLGHCQRDGLGDKKLGGRLGEALKKTVFEHFFDESEGEMQKNFGAGEL